jgi:hypothetical protein
MDSREESGVEARDPVFPGPGAGSTWSRNNVSVLFVRACSRDGIFLLPGIGGKVQDRVPDPWPPMKKLNIPAQATIEKMSPHNLT